MKRGKLVNSPARYWVIVLHSFTVRSPRFLVIKRSELLRRIEAHHGRRDSYPLYFCIVNETNCWEMRGPRAEMRAALDTGIISRSRDFSDRLDNWSQIRRELGAKVG